MNYVDRAWLRFMAELSTESTASFDLIRTQSLAADLLREERLRDQTFGPGYG